MIRFLSGKLKKHTKLAKIVKISIFVNRLVFPMNFNRFSHPMTIPVGTILEYSRMLITRQSGFLSGMDCSINLNLNIKNQNSAHPICIQMVKYWSQIYKFSMHAAVKHFGLHTSSYLKTVILVFKQDNSFPRMSCHTYISTAY